MSMIYIGVVMVILALGFVFAMRMAITAALEADRAWPGEAQTAIEAAAIEPTVIEAAAPTQAASAQPVAVEG